MLIQLVFHAHPPHIWQSRFGDEAINGCNHFINYMKKQLNTSTLPPPASTITTSTTAVTINSELDPSDKHTFFDLLKDFKSK